MKDRLPLIFGLAGVLLLGGGLLWLVRPGPSDEDQVRAAIREVAEGARDGDLAATLRPISDAYVGDEGWTRDELRGFLWREFQRRGTLSVVLSEIEVEVQDDRAEAWFYAAIADGVDLGAFDLLPTDAEAFHFQVSLAREGGEWRITGSHYERYGGGSVGFGR